MTTRFARERGNYTVWGASSLVLMLGLSSLVIDVGSMFSTQAQLVVVTDAGSLAGAAYLDGTSDGLVRARRAALATALANGGGKLELEEDDLAVSFGRWDEATGGFVSDSDPETIDLVRVVSRPWPVWTPFAGALWARPEHPVGASSLARRPAPTSTRSVDCFLPIAVPRCEINRIRAGGEPWIASLRMATDSLDNMAWAHPDGRGANVISGAMVDAVEGDCDTKALEVGDEVQMSNGVEMSVIHTVRDLMRGGDAEPWSTELWGARPPRDARSVFSQSGYPSTGVIQGAVIVFDEDGASCDSVKFVRDSEVDHFVWGAIFDAFAGPGARKGVSLILDLEHDFEVPGSGGGTDGNVLSRPAGRLVE